MSFKKRKPGSAGAGSGVPGRPPRRYARGPSRGEKPVKLRQLLSSLPELPREALPDTIPDPSAEPIEVPEATPSPDRRS